MLNESNTRFTGTHGSRTSGSYNYGNDNLMKRLTAILLVSIILLAFVSIAYAAYVFEDGFELGNGYGGWTGTTTAGTGTVAIDTDPVHHGVNSSRSTGAASADAGYARKTITSIAISYMRAYVYFTTINVVPYYVVYISVFDVGSLGDGTYAGLMNYTVLKWCIIQKIAWSQTTIAGTHAPVTGQWYCIEILRDVTNDNQTLWVNGVIEVTSANAIATNAVRASAGIIYQNALQSTQRLCLRQDP